MDRGTRRGGEGARLWADELVLGWDQPGDVTQHRLPVVSAAEPFTAVRVDACGAGTGLEEPVLGWAQPGVAIQHRLFAAVRVDACGAGTGLEEPVLGWDQPGDVTQHHVPMVSAAGVPSRRYSATAA